MGSPGSSFLLSLRIVCRPGGWSRASSGAAQDPGQPVSPEAVGGHLPRNRRKCDLQVTAPSLERGADSAGGPAWLRSPRWLKSLGQLVLRVIRKQVSSKNIERVFYITNSAGHCRGRAGFAHWDLNILGCWGQRSFSTLDSFHCRSLGAIVLRHNWIQVLKPCRLGSLSAFPSPSLCLSKISGMLLSFPEGLSLHAHATCASNRQPHAYISPLREPNEKKASISQ